MSERMVSFHCLGIPIVADDQDSHVAYSENDIGFYCVLINITASVNPIFYYTFF